jgi:hypothetical protein
MSTLLVTVVAIIAMRALKTWLAQRKRTKVTIDEKTGWPSDCKNVQDLIDKHKPKGMGNLEFLAKIGILPEAGLGQDSA